MGWAAEAEQGASSMVSSAQVVGNLLYYRFLNPAVVAPDAFDVVAMAAGGVLAAPQRHTLGAVAQLLQHAAAGKAYSGGSPHLRVLNDYVEETYPKFRSRVLHRPAAPSPLLFHAHFPSLEPMRKRDARVRRRVRGWRRSCWQGFLVEKKGDLEVA